MKEKVKVSDVTNAFSSNGFIDQFLAHIKSESKKLNNDKPEIRFTNRDSILRLFNYAGIFQQFFLTFEDRVPNDKETTAITLFCHNMLIKDVRSLTELEAVMKIFINLPTLRNTGASPDSNMDLDEEIELSAEDCRRLKII